MKHIESEKTLEARLVREIEARGGMALKYTSQFHRGIPDRICLLPGSTTIFVELKSTGKKPTKLQEYAMKKLVEMGHAVIVIDNTNDLEWLLEFIDNTLRDLPDSDKKFPESDKKFPESDKKFPNSPKN